MIRHADLAQEEIRTQIASGAITMAGNQRLKIYGRLTCVSGRRMKKENRVFFHNAREAEQLGFRPCGRCLPEAYRRWKLVRRGQIL